VVRLTLQEEERGRAILRLPGFTAPASERGLEEAVGLDSSTVRQIRGGSPPGSRIEGYTSIYGNKQIRGGSGGSPPPGGGGRGGGQEAVSTPGWLGYLLRVKGEKGPERLGSFLSFLLLPYMDV